MASNTFSFFCSVFGSVTAAISLFALIIKVCRAQLPSNKIKALLSLLDETESLFQKCIEDGLLIELTFIRETEGHLTM